MPVFSGNRSFSNGGRIARDSWASDFWALVWTRTLHCSLPQLDSSPPQLYTKHGSFNTISPNFIRDMEALRLYLFARRLSVSTGVLSLTAGALLWPLDAEHGVSFFGSRRYGIRSEERRVGKGC